MPSGVDGYAESVSVYLDAFPGGKFHACRLDRETSLNPMTCQAAKTAKRETASRLNRVADKTAELTILQRIEPK